MSKWTEIQQKDRSDIQIQTQIVGSQEEHSIGEKSGLQVFANLKWNFNGSIDYLSIHPSRISYTLPMFSGAVLDMWQAQILRVRQVF